MSAHDLDVTGVKLGYVPSNSSINEPPFIWRNFRLHPLLKLFGGSLQRKGGQIIKDEDKNSKSGI